MSCGSVTRIEVTAGPVNVSVADSIQSTAQPSEEPSWKAETAMVCPGVNPRSASGIMAVRVFPLAW